MQILVTRPQPGGDATTMRLRRGGHDAVLAPLLATIAVEWQRPSVVPQAVLLTSAAAVRLAGDVTELRDLPCFTVGKATAAAARAAGWTDVRAGAGHVQAVIDQLAAGGTAEILHLAGEDRTGMIVPEAVKITTRIVYRAVLQPLSTVPTVDWVLLYSPRTASHFAAECDRIGQPRAGVAIAAISPAALAAAGPGWSRVIAALTPDEDALLAAIGVSCQ
jgi:uroporphyrinogen-III synthase